MSAQTERLKDLIRRDKRVKRVKSAFDNERIYSIPFDEYKDEIKMLHRRRKIHTLSIGSPTFGRELSGAAIEETAIRHRYTEIMGMCVEGNETLKSVLESLERYIMSSFSENLKFLKTKEERRGMIQSILAPFYKYLNQTDTIIKILRLHIEDIDKTGYTVTNLVKAYEIIAKPDRNTNI